MRVLPSSVSGCLPAPPPTQTAKHSLPASIVFAAPGGPSMYTFSFANNASNTPVFRSSWPEWERGRDFGRLFQSQPKRREPIGYCTHTHTHTQTHILHRCGSWHHVNTQGTVAWWRQGLVSSGAEGRVLHIQHTDNFVIHCISQVCRIPYAVGPQPAAVDRFDATDAPCPPAKRHPSYCRQHGSIFPRNFFYFCKKSKSSSTQCHSLALSLSLQAFR